MAALGKVLPPMARSGLMLLSAPGMWGWAQALAAASLVSTAGPRIIAHSTTA